MQPINTHIRTNIFIFYEYMHPKTRNFNTNVRKKDYGVYSCPIYVLNTFLKGFKISAYMCIPVHVTTQTVAWCVGRGASFAYLEGGMGISDP